MRSLETKPDEIIIVTDDKNFPAVAASVPDWGDVRLVKENLNSYAEYWNKAISLCGGKWIALCNVDDYFLPRGLNSIPEAEKRGKNLVCDAIRTKGSDHVQQTIWNPDAALSSGDFRSDLFYRINSFEINIPPLRERREDIKPLTRHILGGIAGVNAPEVSPSAMDALVSYSWPGNVRQLRNALERAVIMCDNGRIESKDLPTEVLAGSREPQGSFVSFPESSSNGVPINLRQTERQQIINALKQTGWHRGKTAELLGISPSTLYRRLRGYELEVR